MKPPGGCRLRDRAADHQAEVASSGGDVRPVDVALSHDLRARLRIIRASIQIFQEEVATTPLDGGEPGTNFLERALEATVMADRLTDRLVQFMRLESSRLMIRPTDLLSLTADIVASHSVYPKVVASSDGGVPPDSGRPGLWATVDAELYSRAITELLDNAVLARDTGAGDAPTPVALAVSRRDHHVVVAVSDCGPGIRPERLHRVFDLARNVHDAADRRGSGLGLSLVERIMVRHGGMVSVGSTVGSGTTVELRFPSIGPDPLP